MSSASFPLTNFSTETVPIRLRAVPLLTAGDPSPQDAERSAFRSGKNLGEEIRADFVETLTCVDCGRTEPEDSAYDNGWQIDPVVCPDCLRWVVTDAGECCF
jgi:hypothetical protein